MIEES